MDPVIIPFTDWMLAVGEDVVQAAIRVQGQTTVGGGNVVAQLAVQTAPVRVDSPDAWGIVATPGLSVTGTSAASNNVTGGAVLQAVSVGTGKMWVRWGAAVALSAAGTGAADVTVALSTVSKGMLVGSWRGTLVTPAASTEATTAITGWVPVAWAEKVYAGLIVASTGANFRCKLVFRTAQFSQDAPGAWTITADTGGGSADRVAFDGNLSAALGTSVQWVQFGLTYWTTSGNATSAEVAASVAVRRA